MANAIKRKHKLSNVIRKLFYSTLLGFINYFVQHLYSYHSNNFVHLPTGRGTRERASVFYRAGLPPLTRSLTSRRYNHIYFYWLACTTNAILANLL